MKRSPALLLLFALFLPAADACVLNLRLTDPTTLAWNAVDGAQMYEVQESFDSNFMTSRNYFIATPSFQITHRVSSETRVRYMVTAILASNILSVRPSSDVCSETLDIRLQPDAAFRAFTRRAIIPIAGSVAGAFGSRFKTSMKLTSNGAGQRGRIIFHPVGAVARASDPSTPYALSFIGDTMTVDDVVDLVGSTGLGSLEIVPDDDASSAIPTVEARLYNDTPGGTFGTTARPVYPFDYLQAPTLTVQVPTGPFRMNLGIRTLTATRAKVLIYGLDARLRTFADLSWPADYTLLASVDQFIGKPVAPGERLILYFDGAAIPFYTMTENRTNDPDLFVARPEQSTDVGSYVE